MSVSTPVLIETSAPYNPNPLNVDTSFDANMVEVTIAPGRTHTVQNGAFTYVFKAGDVVKVPAFEAVYLKRDGVVI
jgi:hypothetical protein